MSYWDLELKTRAAKLGKKIYHDALYDRKGFHEGLDEIDDETWHELFEEMGKLALSGVRPMPSDTFTKGLLQNWVKELPLMQQTVLMTSVRGPDNTPKYGPAKMLLRWYRRCVLVSSLDGKVLADPTSPEGGSFMGPSLTKNISDWERLMSDVVSCYLQELDATPHHFALHFMHAAEIVGYKHDNERIQKWWLDVYNRLVRDMHLTPETESALDERLGDSREGWLKYADPATVD